MTPKDHLDFAQMFREIRLNEDICHYTLDLVENKLCQILEDDSPTFDLELFIEASTPDIDVGEEVGLK